MANDFMLRRAFNQAVNHHAAEQGEAPDRGKIRDYILQYAQKNEVEVTQEEVDRFIQEQEDRAGRA